MQQKSPSKGTFIALTVIIIVALALFFYYKGSPTDADSSLTISNTQESTDATLAAERVLILLNTISSLKIDDSVFKSAVYRSLVDYTIAIPEQGVGRANPFAPYGGVPAPAKPSASTGR